MSVDDFSQDAGVSPVLTRVSPEQICKYWEKHVADAAIFVRLWKTEKFTKISKKTNISKSSTFDSYRIFLVQISTVCFGKVQYIPT